MYENILHINCIYTTADFLDKLYAYNLFFFISFTILYPP